MELTFEQAEKEAAAEFGSLVIPDGDAGPITILTPLWLEDQSKIERISERMNAVAEFDKVASAEQLESLPGLKTALVDLLAECADRPDQWRAQASTRPLPVVLSIFRAWQEAAQPGEASRSSG